MAKHASNNNSLGSATNGSQPYVYPDGRVYGAPYVEPSSVNGFNSAQAQNTPGVYATPVQAQDAQAYGRENYMGYNAFSSKHTEQLRKRRRRKRIIGTVAGVLLTLMLLVGFGAWRYFAEADRALAHDDKSYASSIVDKLSSSKAEEPFYTLIVAYDSFAIKEKEDSNTDVLLLARVDIAHNLVTLVSIPRDTPRKGEDGNYYKINQLYKTYGMGSVIDAVEDLTGVKINHIIEVRIDKLEGFIDSIGGIEYDVPVTIHHNDKSLGEEFVIEAGPQTLTGHQAMVVMRSRKEYASDQDANRQSTVRGVIQATYKKALSVSPTELPGVLLQAAECIDTDLKSQQLLSIATGLGSNVTFYSGTGPSEGERDPGSNDLWMCYLNPTGWERLMTLVNEGKDPGDISYKDDMVYIPSSGEVPESKQFPAEEVLNEEELARNNEAA